MLSTKTIFGAGWVISSRLAGRLIDFLTLLFLARALSPADFGLTALAASLIAILDTALEIPLSQALTRLKAVEKAHLDTAFTLGILRGAGLSIVLVAAAWPFALLYHDPRLAALICFLALGPVARSLYSPAMVHFVRQISFRQAFAAEIIGKLTAAGAAITLVRTGAGYWAIAVNSVAAPLVATAVSHLVAPYRPALSVDRFREFRSFLGWFSSAQLLVAASWQIDRGLLGYFVSKATLGKYTMASDIAVMPTQSLIGPAMTPVMAAFSRIADERERLVSAYLRALTFTMMIAAPAGIGISLTADLAVDALLGPKWAESAFYLRWLSLATVLSAFYAPLYSLALAVNRPVLLFRFNLLEISCKILLVALGFYAFGLNGVVAARGAVSLIMVFVVLFAARRLAGISPLAQLASVWRVAFAAATMAALVLVLRHELAGRHLGDFVALGVIAAFGAAVYAAALFVLGVRPGLGARPKFIPEPRAN
jgi:PST family polysaccharide transporter